MVNRNTTIRCGAILLGLVIVVTAAAGAEGEYYFTATSISGTLSYNNPPSQAMFYAGKHRRTYVTYMGDDYNAWITYYDHDTKRWTKPVKVDDCRYKAKDGHNNPELLITRDGYLHLFYGCHGNPVKYARSLYPEDITRWRLGKEFGARSTYPHPVQVGNGDILVFCRRHLPVSGTEHAVTFVYRSTDNGSTWDEGTQLVSFRSHPDEEYRTRAYQRAFMYDATEDLIYCALIDQGSVGKTWANAKRTYYSVKYDPTTRHLIAMNGVDLGPSANRADLDANQCRQRLFFVQLGARVIALEPPEVLTREKLKWLHLYTADGIAFKVYGGGSPVTVWTSNDGGQTWDEGQAVVPEGVLDEKLGNVNVVRNYSGSGPFLILAGADRHSYDDDVFGNQGFRLYAVDRDYQLVASRGTETH